MTPSLAPAVRPFDPADGDAPLLGNTKMPPLLNLTGTSSRIQTPTPVLVAVSRGNARPLEDEVHESRLERGDTGSQATAKTETTVERQQRQRRQQQQHRRGRDGAYSASTRAMGVDERASTSARSDNGNGGSGGGSGSGGGGGELFRTGAPRMMQSGRKGSTSAVAGARLEGSISGARARSRVPRLPRRPSTAVGVNVSVCATGFGAATYGYRASASALDDTAPPPVTEAALRRFGSSRNRPSGNWSNNPEGHRSTGGVVVGGGGGGGGRNRMDRGDLVGSIGRGGNNSTHARIAEAHLYTVRATSARDTTEIDSVGMVSGTPSMGMEPRRGMGRGMERGFSAQAEASRDRKETGGSAIPAYTGATLPGSGNRAPHEILRASSEPLGAGRSIAMAPFNQAFKTGLSAVGDDATSPVVHKATSAEAAMIANHGTATEHDNGARGAGGEFVANPLAARLTEARRYNHHDLLRVRQGVGRSTTWTGRMYVSGGGSEPVNYAAAISRSHSLAALSASGSFENTGGQGAVVVQASKSSGLRLGASETSYTPGTGLKDEEWPLHPHARRHSGGRISTFRGVDDANIGGAEVRLGDGVDDQCGKGEGGGVSSPYDKLLSATNTRVTGASSMHSMANHRVVKPPSPALPTTASRSSTCAGGDTYLIGFDTESTTAALRDRYNIKLLTDTRVSAPDQSTLPVARTGNTEDSNEDDASIHQQDTIDEVLNDSSRALREGDNQTATALKAREIALDLELRAMKTYLRYGIVPAASQEAAASGVHAPVHATFAIIMNE